MAGHRSAPALEFAGCIKQFLTEIAGLGLIRFIHRLAFLLPCCDLLGARLVNFHAVFLGRGVGVRLDCRDAITHVFLGLLGRRLDDRLVLVRQGIPELGVHDDNKLNVGMISNGNLIAEGSPTEIVRKVHNGDLVQVTVRESEQNLRNILVDVDEIKEILFFRDIEPRGCQTHFVVENADSDLPKIQKLLYSKKIDVLTAGKVPISMEDAFIKLMAEGS